jgi:hypothetical protein
VATKDFVAGMADRYAMNLYGQLSMPKPWVRIARIPNRESLIANP